jgi:ABC-type branched-subunit amino acid transport system substrate-binding protein
MKYFLLLIIFIQFVFIGKAQNLDSTNKVIYKVAVLAPIYIDSVFTGDNFKVTGHTLPKNVLPGLDFYNGVMMAVDSLQKEKMPLEIIFFDTKNSAMPMKKILAQKVWDSVSLILVSFKDRLEIKPLADFAKLKKIPLVSVTYPNEGGVTDNPYFVLLNSTLKTHCEGIYKYIQKKYSTQNLIYIKRKGKLENEIENSFLAMKEVTPGIPLKYKTVLLSDTFNIQQLKNVLDSNKQNVVICGSVNENFGKRLVNNLSALNNIATIAIGMPTWSSIKEFKKVNNTLEETKGIEIIYSTPYNYNREVGLGKYLTEVYKNKFYARASDWFFKGYDATYNFCHLLVKYPNDFINSLSSDSSFSNLINYNIQPVLNKQEVPSIDFFENKNLYFFKRQDGAIKSID